jgi:uncharacterized repeat protein (TIGR01451 family)
MIASIDVTKVADADVVLADEMVSYTVSVRNDGEVPVTIDSITDPMFGTITFAPFTLAIGEVSAPIALGTASFATTGVHPNTVVVGGTSVVGPVSDSDTEEVLVVAPAIDVVKTASPTTVLAGETVVYTYTVINTGDVPLEDVVLIDDKKFDGPVNTEAVTLGIDESRTFSWSTGISVQTTNTVTATAVDSYGHAVSDQDDAFVDVIAPFTAPDLTIEKTADQTTATRGEIVRYTLTYRNLSAGSATDITIVDDFDERYVTILDAAGGDVKDGKITWKVPGPLFDEDGAQTITYSVRINQDVPDDVSVVRNTVLISTPGEENTDNNRDSWEVELDEPFLPFTGGELLLMLLAAAVLATAGLVLRITGRRAIPS